MAAKKPSRKKIGGRTLTRIVTVSVFLICGAIVVMTVWFFASTLSTVDRAQQSSSKRPAKPEINSALLDTLLDFHAKRGTAARYEPSQHANPYIPVQVFEIPGEDTDGDGTPGAATSGGETPPAEGTPTEPVVPPPTGGSVPTPTPTTP